MRARLTLVAIAVSAFAVGCSSRPESGDPHVIKHDPIEADPAYRAQVESADREARLEFDRQYPKKSRGLGSIHGFWGIKKDVLKKKYGLDWRTPAEMNPKMAFD